MYSQITAAAAAAKSLQLCLTLCDPIDSSPPGSPISGILQARTLEWVAISFSSQITRYIHIWAECHCLRFGIKKKMVWDFLILYHLNCRILYCSSLSPAKLQQEWRQELLDLLEFWNMFWSKGFISLMCWARLIPQYRLHWEALLYQVI